MAWSCREPGVRDAGLALRGARVIVVSHGFQPNYERGFTNGLARNGAHVTLISSDRTEVSALEPDVQALNLRGSQDSSRPAWRKALNMCRYHLSLLWLTLTRRRCTVHVTGLLMPVVWCGILQALWFRVFSQHYVLTIHNLMPHGSHTRAARFLYGLAYAIPDRIVVHTRLMRQQLIDEFKVGAERIVTMEHGIEPLGSSVPSPPDMRTTGPLHLLFFGALERYKGLDILLQALSRDVPEFRLQIAGPCVDSSLAGDTEDAIHAHPHHDSIAWTRQFIPERDVPALFLNADVLILPYRHIDQSGVLFQALRYGLPVIAADVGSFRHYISEEVGEICERGDPEALAQALQKFALRRGQYSRARIQDIGRAYEWPHVVPVLAAAYVTGDRRS